MERSGEQITSCRASEVADGGAPSGDAAQPGPSSLPDQAAADEARLRFHREGLPSLPVEGRVRSLLAAGEDAVAARDVATLERREPTAGDRGTSGVAGELYVTSRRLVLVGRPTLSIELDSIEDALLSGERVLLVLRDGHGVVVTTDRPRLLLVEIAAARASAKSGPGRESAAAPQDAAR